MEVKTETTFELSLNFILGKVKYKRKVVKKENRETKPRTTKKLR